VFQRRLAGWYANEETAEWICNQQACYELMGTSAFESLACYNDVLVGPTLIWSTDAPTTPASGTKSASMGLGAGKRQKTLGTPLRTNVDDHKRKGYPKMHFQTSSPPSLRKKKPSASGYPLHTIRRV
jgi:hypothetical protein